MEEIEVQELEQLTPATHLSDLRVCLINHSDRALLAQRKGSVNID